MRILLITTITFVAFLAGCSAPEPEGSIFCVSGPIGSGEIRRVSASTGGVISIIDTPHDDISPGVFGNELVFISVNNGDSLYLTADLDSMVVRPVADSSLDSLLELYGRVSSGEWVAFVERGGEDSRIMWIPRPGAEPVLVSGEGEKACDPCISRGNALLAYSSIPEGKNDRAVVVKSLPEGRTLALFDTDNDDLAPSLSRDGFWVAFQSGKGESSEIILGYIPDGYTRTLVKGRQPCWRP